MEHTKEPWVFGSRGQIIGSAGRGDTVCIMIDEEIIEANSRRIVACVNACAGLSTEDLESGCLDVMGKYAMQLEKQRDELLEAIQWLLHRAYSEWETESGNVEYAEACEHARSIIASVKDAAMRTTEQSSADGETK